MSSRRQRVAVLAANWKMNIGPQRARTFMETFLRGYAPRPERRVLFFPPAVSIEAVATCCAARQDISVGVQNIYYRDEGAYTGEVSAPMAREAGASYCLVGHSERRDIFEETDDTARHKCRAALRAQMTPLLCVGEARSERVEGRTADVVGRQIRTVITNLDASQIGSMMFAYEPLWAIGTGDSASPQDAASVHQHIRFLLRQAAGPTVADGVPILYGGSVRPGNAAELLNATDVDGLLVGGASLKEESWLEIVGA